MTDMRTYTSKESELKKLSEEFGYVYVDYHGIVYPPFTKPDAIDELRENFVPSNNDIMVVTYPKCGTAWGQQIVQLLLNGGKQDRTVCNTLWLELQASLGKLNSATLQSDETKERRIFKCHSQWHLLPCKELSPGTKVVYVGRNPKDVVVSFFHHHQHVKIQEYSGDFHHFLHLFCDGKVAWGSWFDHNIGWWEASKKFPDQILFVTYEDLKLKPMDTVTKIANFIEVENISEEMLQDTIKNSSFEEMKEFHAEATFPSYSKNHFRKGAVGDWKNHFTVTQDEMFDQCYKEKMQSVSSELQFQFS